MAKTKLKKKSKRTLMASLGMTFIVAGTAMSLGATPIQHASADETNKDNLSQNTATDIPSDQTPNYQNVDGYKIDVPRTNSQGSYAYCIEAGKSGMTDYSGQLKALNGLAGTVLCNGQTAKGKLAQYAPINKYNEQTRVVITQYAVWIALGQGNNTDTGFEDGTTKVNQTGFYKKYQSDIEGLVNYSKTHQPEKITPADEQEKIDQAQKDLDKQAQDDVANQLKTVSQSLKDELTNAQNQEITNALNDELSKASKALHIDPVAVKNTDATKAKLGDKFDGNDAQGHFDNIENGSHDFSFKINHDEVQGVNWNQKVKVHFENKLPKDTVIKVNGKEITKDASQTQDYEMNVGDTYTVQIPFDDKNESTTETLKATATLEASYTAKAKSKEQKVTSDKKTTVKFNLMGLGAGYKDPDNPAGQKRAVSYMVATPSTKDLTAHAEQTAKVDIPEKTEKKGGNAEANYSFTYKRMLGRLVINKLGVPNDPDAQAQATIDKVESQNDFANGFNVGQKPNKISADGSNSAFNNLPQSEQKYQNGGANLNGNTKVSADGSLSSTKSTNDKSSSATDNNANTGIATGELNADGTNKVVKLADVTFQLVPRNVENLEVLKQYYPLSDGNGSQITLPKVTDNNGQIVWDNIPYGDYDLIEVQTSNGYVLNSQPVHVGADRYHVGTNNVVVQNKGEGATTPQVESHTTPWIHTTALSSDGDKYRDVSSHETAIDTAAVGGLDQGTYHVLGYAMKEDGTPVDANAKATDITIKIDKDGETKIVNVPYTFDGSNYKGKIIFAEAIYTDNNGKPGEQIVKHANPTDSAQTLLAPTTSTVGKGSIQNSTPTSTSTPVPTGYGTTASTPSVVGTPLQQTGENNKANSGLIATIAGGITAMLGTLYGLFRKKHQ